MGLLETFNSGQTSVDRLAEKIRNPFETGARVLGRPNDFAGGFVFKEILADGSFGLKVQLLNNQMPMIPFEGIGGEQRIQKDYYPGNAEPTIQVLGPKERDVVIRGKLSDKRLKDQSLYGASSELAEQIDFIRLRGNLLMIQLGEFIRFGYLQKAEFPMKTLAELEYTLTFTIIGARKPQNQNLLEETKLNPYEINQELIDRLAEEQLANQNRSLKVKQSIYNRFSSLFSTYVATPISTLTNFVDSVLTARNDIEDSIARAVGLLAVCRSNMARFHRELGREDYDLTSETVSTQTATVTFLSSAQSNSSEFSRIFAQYQDLLDQLRQTSPSQRHVVKEGDTLQRLAMKYFNDGSLWKEIYDHNELDTTQLTIGDILEIPNL